MKPETVHFRISRLEESLQVTSPSDQKKAIFMTQAFNLLILIFSVIGSGWVLNHVAITPVTLKVFAPLQSVWFLRFYYLFLICGFDKVACSSFAKPGKHFLIETDDAAEEEDGAGDSKDYGRKESFICQ